MLRTTLITLFAIVILYAAFVAVVYMFQDRMLYFPEKGLHTTPGHYEMVFDPVTLNTSDRETLRGWWVPAESARGVVIFLHGNAGNMAGRMEQLKIFNRLRLSTFIFDYRGYGESTGKPSENGLYEDAETAWRYLTETRGVDPMKIVIFGKSLGGAVATWLANRHSCRAVILESTFTSVPDLAARFYPYLPVRLLARDRFDSMTRIHNLQSGAVLVIHSRSDEIVPFEHGQTLHEALRGNKEFLEISGGHNTGYQATGDDYVRALDAFLDENLGP